MWNIVNGEFNVTITKNDNEFKFNAEYQFVDYYGVDRLEALQFIEDWDGYWSNRVEITYENDVVSLLLSVPFSKKNIKIDLIKREMSEVEELRIQIRRQNKVIVDQGVRISILETRFNNAVIDNYDEVPEDDKVNSVNKRNKKIPGYIYGVSNKMLNKYVTDIINN